MPSCLYLAFLMEFTKLETSALLAKSMIQYASSPLIIVIWVVPSLVFREAFKEVWGSQGSICEGHL